MMTNNELSKLAKQINRLHREAEGFATNALHSAIRCGGLLEHAKQGLPHGTWAQWVADNCEFTLRTAQRWIRLHEGRQVLENATSVTHLQITAALRMLSDADDPDREAEREERLADLARKIQESHARFNALRPYAIQWVEEVERTAASRGVEEAEIAGIPAEAWQAFRDVLDEPEPAVICEEPDE